MTAEVSTRPGKVWLFGESNPFGDPGMALWPEPDGCAGDRLCRILGHARDEYVATYERRNLLQLAAGEGWPTKRAREAAALALQEPADGDAIVLLGSKVSAAFGVQFFALTRHFLTRLPRPALRALVIPHPSGGNFMWRRDPTLAPRVREAVARLRKGPETPRSIAEEALAAPTLAGLERAWLEINQAAQSARWFAENRKTQVGVGCYDREAWAAAASARDLADRVWEALRTARTEAAK